MHVGALQYRVRCSNKGGEQPRHYPLWQLFMISGMGENGEDLTNDLSYLLLEVIDDMSPILGLSPTLGCIAIPPQAA